MIILGRLGVPGRVSLPVANIRLNCPGRGSGGNSRAATSNTSSQKELEFVMIHSKFRLQKCLSSHFTISMISPGRRPSQAELEGLRPGVRRRRAWQAARAAA